MPSILHFKGGLIRWVVLNYLFYKGFRETKREKDVTNVTKKTMLYMGV